MTTTSLAAGNPVFLGETIRVQVDPFENLTEGDRRRARKYLDVRLHADGWTVAKKARYAGLVEVGGITYWLEPPFSPASFIYLLLQAKGLSHLAGRAHSLASNRRNRSLSDLMQVLALVMVQEAEVLAAGHIAQSYIRRTERLGVVRGRPLWHSQAARPADGTVLCRFEEKSTDNLENRLVLAGLDAAARWLPARVAGSAVRTQQFVWRSLAEPCRPARHDFGIANARLSRLTAGYRPALAVAQALLFGFEMNSTQPNTRLVAPVFDLAVLFEKLVELVARTGTAGTNLVVDPQTSERRAIRASTGESYRTIRPDIVIRRADGEPALVIDSKFKPRYGAGGPTPVSANRLSREDIFQTFFYAHRVAQRAGLSIPVPAAVAAPQLAGAVPPSGGFRRLRWTDDGDESASRLSLLLIPVDEAVEAVKANDSAYCAELIWPSIR